MNHLERICAITQTKKEDWTLLDKDIPTYGYVGNTLICGTYIGDLEEAGYGFYIPGPQTEKLIVYKSTK